jgi:hypothetical protein
MQPERKMINILEMGGYSVTSNQIIIQSICIYLSLHGEQPHIKEQL